MTGSSSTARIWKARPGRHRIPHRDGPPARVIDSGPDADLEKVEFAVLQAVSCARSSIAVMTPYFLPDERLITALSLAAMRGVAVDLVIPHHSNHTPGRLGDPDQHRPFARRRRPDLAQPAAVPPCQADGRRREWCLIGSCNWDIRSFRLNFELCMEVYDRDLAATLTR